MKAWRQPGEAPHFWQELFVGARVEHVPHEQEGFVLEQERILPAPPERVFALFVEPAELAKWWGPRGFTVPEVHLDLRVGGGYRLTMQPPEGEAFHLSGQFVEIEAPHRLSFSFRWDEPAPTDRETVVVVSLCPVNGGTQMSLWHGRFTTEERLALHTSGWADSLEKLEAETRRR